MRDDLKSTQMLINELFVTISSYEQEAVDLDDLCFKAEVYLERLQEFLPAAAVSEALNCVYLLEEINAVVLSEVRQINAAESKEIEKQLERLRSELASVLIE